MKELKLRLLDIYSCKSSWSIGIYRGKILDGKYPKTANFPRIRKKEEEIKLQSIFSRFALPFLTMLYISKFL
jgi:hypothetical protein